MLLLAMDMFEYVFGSLAFGFDFVFSPQVIPDVELQNMEE